MSAFGTKRTSLFALQMSASKRTLTDTQPLPKCQFELVRWLILRLGVDMRRRDFIALIGGSAAALPCVALAQNTAPDSRVVGYLSGRSEDVETALLAGVRKGLQETGYTEGSNLTLVRRWADGHYERLPDMAAELVNLKAGVILTTGGPQTARVAIKATNQIPIVFLSGSDPVIDGLVKSHNRPGGNVTGVHVFTTSLGPKRLDYLRQLVPSGTVFGFLLKSERRHKRSSACRDRGGVARCRSVDAALLCGE